MMGRGLDSTASASKVNSRNLYAEAKGLKRIISPYSLIMAESRRESIPMAIPTERSIRLPPSLDIIAT